MTALHFTALAGLLAAAILPASALAKPPPKAVGLTGMWALDTEWVEADMKLVMPLTPAALAVKKADQEALAKGDVIGHNGKRCGPSGMPTMMVNEFALEFLETPDRITILNEAATVPRSVYLDETTHATAGEPGWNGHSIGHWKGKVLTIDTTNFNDKGALFGFVGVHSSTTHLVERYHLENGGQKLVGSFTFEDPRYLTKPWTATVTYHRLPPHSELWEYVCEPEGGWIERFQGDPEAKK